MQALKRRKPAAAAASHEQQQQGHKQHSSDHSHIRKHHAVDEDEGNGTQQKEAAAAALEPQPSDTAAAAAAAAPAAAPPASNLQQQGKHQQHHKRSKGQPKQLLSFTEEEDAEEAAAAAPAEAAVSAAAAAAPPDNSNQEQQEQQPAKQSHGSIARATASRFAQEIKAQAAAAARMMFRPSGSAAAAGAAGAAAAGGAAVGAVLVDEDEDPRAAARAAATAGLSQIHFGFATARGHRPYMEDRHTIITTLNPATAQQAAAALDAAEHPAAVGGDDAAANGREQQHAAVTHDGVGRCYAAIFDGHNGAGAAETAARKLHLLLASHPALRLYRGETGPPAVVKQEEAAVGSALKQAFRQVDDMVLSTARHEGTRDGATALVLLRLGNALYAAHAGDSRAVLCRDAAAYRLTEDHKPHLPHERSRIEEAGGRVDFQRCWRVVVEPRDGRPGSGLAVSRSLGDLDFKEPYRYVECEPDVTRLPLQPRRDTFVVLGSDGLWDVLSDTDAVITAAAALKAYTANHSSNNNAGSSPAGAIDATGSSNSSIPCGLALHMGRARHKPGQHGSGPHARGISAFGGLGSAELPDSLVYSDAAATAAAEVLLAESMRRGTMDNVTVIVMLLQWS
ncbi:hypothetical protein OEZ86_007274 [Tetradesmus obliquus]|nr:hypothetical protein OEZ86_007274 [Tetradesmus obliquus]